MMPVRSGPKSHKPHAESKFEKYRIVQDRLFESDFDPMLKQLPETGTETHAEARRTRREKLPRRRVRLHGLHRAWLSRRGWRGVGFLFVKHHAHPPDVIEQILMRQLVEN